MANAKKCDICRKFYEIYNTDHDQTKPNGLAFINIDLDNEYCLTDDDEYIECCPKCMNSIQGHIEKLRGDIDEDDMEPTPFCQDCKHSEEPFDNDYCNSCDLICNKFEPKPLMATSFSINQETFTAVVTLDNRWRGPLNERIIPGEIRDHYTCTIDGVVQEVVLSPKLIEDLKKWR